MVPRCTPPPNININPIPTVALERVRQKPHICSTASERAKFEACYVGGQGFLLPSAWMQLAQLLVLHYLWEGALP